MTGIGSKGRAIDADASHSECTFLSLQSENCEQILINLTKHLVQKIIDVEL